MKRSSIKFFIIAALTIVLIAALFIFWTGKEGRSIFQKKVEKNRLEIHGKTYSFTEASLRIDSVVGGTVSYLLALDIGDEEIFHVKEWLKTDIPGVTVLDQLQGKNLAADSAANEPKLGVFFSELIVDSVEGEKMKLSFQGNVRKMKYQDGENTPVSAADLLDRIKKGDYQLSEPAPFSGYVMIPEVAFVVHELERNSGTRAM